MSRSKTRVYYRATLQTCDTLLRTQLRDAHSDFGA